MKNTRFFIISFLFLAAALNMAKAQQFSEAGPGSLIATVDSNCIPRPTQFSIGQDFLAVQFNIVAFNGGTNCTTGRPVDEKGFSIENQNGTEIFKWFQSQDNPPLQPLGLLNFLSLSSGIYTLKVNGGSNAQVILRFHINDMNQQTLSAPLLDSDRDGVPDQWDKCPNTPPNSFVDSNGCPGQIQINDADGDGVIDLWDIEPNTPPNSLVDRNGQAAAASSIQAKPTSQPQTPNLTGPAPWEIWLGRWEVVSTYTNCPAASTLSWWFEVSRQGKGYSVLVQSGQKTKIDTLSDQNLEFNILDEAKTQIALWLTSEGQCEGTVMHPKNVRECQQGRIEGRKRSE